MAAAGRKGQLSGLPLRCSSPGGAAVDGHGSSETPLGSLNAGGQAGRPSSHVFLCDAPEGHERPCQNPVGHLLVSCLAGWLVHWRFQARHQCVLCGSGADGLEHLPRYRVRALVWNRRPSSARRRLAALGWRARRHFRRSPALSAPCGTSWRGAFGVHAPYFRFRVRFRSSDLW